METIFEGRVRSMSSEGHGVVEGPEGRVFFVPAVWVGDLARFEIVELKKKFGHARLVELIEGSPARRSSPCPHAGWDAGSCGGCPWHFVNYEAQVEAKEDRIRHSLKKFASLDEVLQPMWASEEEWGYRNRAQFKTDGQSLGFVSHSSQSLAPVEDCIVLTETNRDLLKKLLEKLPNKDWKVSQGHSWNALDVDEDLAMELGDEFDSKDLILNRRRPFRQANEAQNLRMKEWLFQKLLPLDRGSHVLELFAGSGNFTEVIANLGFESVCASEVVMEAMDNLKAKKFANLKTVAADLFHNTSYRLIQNQFPKADVLVLDPPREGLKEKAGLLAAFPMIKAVAYISCDLATFSRDLHDFVAAGFEIREIQPLDQFPQTPHIEMMAWLVRDK